MLELYIFRKLSNSLNSANLVHETYFYTCARIVSMNVLS